MNKIAILVVVSSASMYLSSCGNSDEAGTQSQIQRKDTVETETPTSYFKSPKADVTVEEAYVLSKQGALIIDVREPEELADVAFDVKNIKNIPIGELELRLAEVPKDKQVIVACKRGNRSAKAYEILKAKGFENIANMEGGMDEWLKKGLPVFRGVKITPDK